MVSEYESINLRNTWIRFIEYPLYLSLWDNCSFHLNELCMSMTLIIPDTNVIIRSISK